MSTETRDRAFDRVLIIETQHRERVNDILKSIDRDGLIKRYEHLAGYLVLVLKIKKQELLMIKLSIPVHSVKRLDKNKKVRIQLPKIGNW